MHRGARWLQDAEHRVVNTVSEREGAWVGNQIDGMRIRSV